VLGNKFEVNGKIQPFFQVHPRRYRFRWLDAGPSRFYEFFLTDLSNQQRVIPFELIASDGNLGVDYDVVSDTRISKSARVNSVRLGVAERADCGHRLLAVRPPHLDLHREPAGAERRPRSYPQRSARRPRQPHPALRRGAACRRGL
jgi:hypothetical protein